MNGFKLKGWMILDIIVNFAYGAYSLSFQSQHETTFPNPFNGTFLNEK